MDNKRTRGGKKKLTFAPKLPAAPKELEEEPEPVERSEEGAVAPRQEQPKTAGERRKPGKPPGAAPGVALSGGAKDTPGAFMGASVAEITPAALAQLENGPRTSANVLQRETVYRERVAPDEFAREGRYLLQLPRMAPAGGGRYLRGTLRIETDGTATLAVTGQSPFSSGGQELRFALSLARVPVPQEVYRQHETGPAYVSTGALNAKLISQINGQFPTE